MKRVPINSDCPPVTSEGDGVDAPIAADGNELVANKLAAFDEQLRQGRVRDSTVHWGDTPLDVEPPAELVACLHLIERIWPRVTPPAATSAGPGRIGRFEIERVLGQGGFGIVYLARDTALHRLVALKVPRLHSLADKKLRERFYREARAAAALDHPNIVPILEAGEEGPICYLASAYCPGPNLAEWMKQQTTPVSPRLAAALVLQLADAAHYSHTHGVLHRDLKPSNVMLVTEERANATAAEVSALPFTPRLTDFGLAKLSDGPFDETAASAMLGTPAYMAPEQASGLGEQVGPHTDVYALGAVLYELLVGRPPFQSTNVADVLDEVRNNEPVPPRRLRREIPRDLEIICLKCLEKKTGRRYGTARELSDDLNRFLHGEPVRARRPGVAYTVYKWMRRRPALAFAAAVSSLAVLALLLGGWYYNQQLAQALQVAQRLQTESVDRERRLQLQLYAADLRTAWKAWEAGDTKEALGYLIRHQPQRGEVDLRGFEWHFLQARCQPGVLTLLGHLSPILTVDVSPDDKFIASGDRGGTVKIWDLATGSELKTLQYGAQEVNSVRFAPDGRTLATAGQDRTVRLWNVKDWSEEACLRGHELTVTSLAWSPDSRQLASGGRDNQLRIWDTHSHHEVQTLPVQADVIRCVAWSPNGKFLAAAVRENGLHVWDTKDWRLRPALQPIGTNNVLAIAFSPDSRRLVSSGYGGRLMIHDLGSQQTVLDVELSSTVWSLSFAPNGSFLMAGRSDGLLQLWEAQAADGELNELRTIQVGEGDVRGVVFAQGGKTIITALEQDRVLQVRNAAELAGRRPYRYEAACLDVARDTNRAIVLKNNGKLRLSSFPPRQPQGPDLPHVSGVRDAVFSAQGNLMATVGNETGVMVYDTRNMQLRHRLNATERILAVTISADGQSIAGSSDTGAVWLWNVKDQSLIHRLEGHQKPTVRAAFSSDGKLLATASSNEQQVFLWDIATGRRVGELPIAQDVMALTFSPDNRTLAVAGFEHLAMLWDVSTQSQMGTLRGHVGAIRAVAYSPDGQTLVTAGDDGTARLWHVPTRQELCILIRRSLPLHWIRFLSSGQLVVSTSSSGSGSQRSNDVLVFDADELAPNNRDPISLAAQDGPQITNEP